MVRVTFIPGSATTEAAIELVEPAGPRSPVTKFLKNGGGLHHVCYEVSDLNAEIQRSKDTGDVMVRVPLPAEAFGGRKIVWFLTASKLLVEYVER
jgi:methylmalonyl-CoA/ethylmalonyl-CoA epimerase